MRIDNYMISNIHTSLVSWQLQFTHNLPGHTCEHVYRYTLNFASRGEGTPTGPRSACALISEERRRTNTFTTVALFISSIRNVATGNNVVIEAEGDIKPSALLIL